ncbi:hypothetical protein AB9F46_28720 [Rhizobium leguminosarum]|uniref:hypothetical protein n=1 Tax=Rhizobium leguminosarum TaxID=384 RepID=UPI0012BC196E|nr:hypothetical protein [Rhizobium leguminosarum]
MKSNFGESMFWLAMGSGGDGSPQSCAACCKGGSKGRRLDTDPMAQISRARQKPNSLLFFARIFRIVEPINNQGKA